MYTSCINVPNTGTKYIFDGNIIKKIFGINCQNYMEFMYVCICILCCHLKIYKLRSTYVGTHSDIYVTVSAKPFLFAYFTQIVIISELIFEPIFNCFTLKCRYIRSWMVMVDMLYHNTINNCLQFRPRPIMLKILPIMLLSSAQKISPLCSILCS